MLLFLGLLSLGAAGGLLLVGCPPPPPPTSAPQPNRYPGVTLAVACPAEAVQLIRDYAKRWESRAGGAVDVKAYDAAAGPPADADVWVLEPAELPTHAAAGRLQRVPEALTKGDSYAWDRLLPVYKDKLLLWGDAAFAVPLLGDAPLLFYRTDLLADAKAEPPQTWEEYLKLAARPGQGGGPSLPPLPEADAALDREFFAVAAPFARRALRDADPNPPEAELFSFHFDMETMKPRIDGPAFVHALKLLQGLQKHRPPGAGAPAEAFAAGKAVMCVGEARWADLFNRSPAVKGKFAVVRLPGADQVFPYGGGEPTTETAPNRIPYLGSAGWLAAVAAGSGKGDAAWDLLADLTGPHTSEQMVLEPRWGGGAVRRTQLENAAGWRSFGLGERTGVMVNALQDELLHPGLKNPVVRLRLPGQREYQKALLDEVRQALLNGKAADRALADAAARWQKLEEKEDREALRRDYYLSLGLRPR